MKLPPLREKLADTEHTRWANWQRWLHSKLNKSSIGMVMKPEDYQHWEEQIASEYVELSEPEKDSDRKEADITLAIIDQYLPEPMARMEYTESSKSDPEEHQRIKFYNRGAVAWNACLQEVRENMKDGRDD